MYSVLLDSYTTVILQPKAKQRLLLYVSFSLHFSTLIDCYAYHPHIWQYALRVLRHLCRTQKHNNPKPLWIYFFSFVVFHLNRKQFLYYSWRLPRCPCNAALYAHNIAPPTRTKAVVNNKSETRKIMWKCLNCILY